MTRKYNIICTEKYLLVVDDSQITEGDYCLANAKTYNNEIVTYRKSPCPPPFVSNLNILKKIIAHLPLNGSSTLDSVDLLPPLPDEVEEMAMKKLKSRWSHLYTFGYPKKPYPTNYENDLNMVMVGIYQAKEKYKYTEEDIMKAIKMAREFNKLIEEDGYDEFRYTQEHIIQSLQQPKMPIGFECEIEKADYWYLENNNLIKPKTTVADGLTQWTGQYTY
jgi:hypothetical protein